MGVISQGCSMTLDVWACMCGFGVGIAKQSRDMRLHGPVGVGDGMGLGGLVGGLLGCTALMRANSPKHPSGCLQFAKIDVIQREHWVDTWVVVDVCYRIITDCIMWCVCVYASAHSLVAQAAIHNLIYLNSIHCIFA